MKLLLSLAFCLLFTAPLWAADISLVDGATFNASGLYALSKVTTTGSVKELTDNELAAVEGGDGAIVFQQEPGFITVTTSSGNINSMGQYDLPHPVFPVGDQALIIGHLDCGAGCQNFGVIRPGGTTYLNAVNIH